MRREVYVKACLEIGILHLECKLKNFDKKEIARNFTVTTLNLNDIQEKVYEQVRNNIKWV